MLKLLRGDGNGDKYRDVVEKIKGEDNTGKKLDYVALLLCMMATNDLAHLYARLEKVVLILYVFLGVFLVHDMISFKTIISIIAKVL